MPSGSSEGKKVLPFQPAEAALLQYMCGLRTRQKPDGFRISADRKSRASKMMIAAHNTVADSRVF